MTSPYAVVINIDGSFRPITKKSGLAGLITYPESFNRESEEIFSLTYSPATINQMELEACIKALTYLYNNAQELRVNHAIIYSDSRYVTEHQYLCYTWRKSKWIKKDGLPVKNAESWKRFIRERSKAASRISKIEIIWKAGKSSPENKIVDKLAKKASSGVGGIRHPSYTSARVTRTLGEDKGLAIPYPAANQKVNARVYMDVHNTKYLEIRFEEYDIKNKTFGKKYVAYTEKARGHLIHRGSYYVFTMNNDIRLPYILRLRKLGIKHLPKKSLRVTPPI